MSVPKKYWAYRQPNGCVSLSPFHDADTGLVRTPVDGPEGTWELLDEGTWNRTAEPCVRGVCVHVPKSWTWPVVTT